MIEILKYQNNLQKEWDDFIDISHNGTIFQKQKFLSYHIDREFNDCSLIFKKRKKIIAVFPAALKEDKNNKILFSHPGASFGGIIYQNLSFEECNMIIQLIENFARKNSCTEIFLIQTPFIYVKNNDEIVDYCLRYNQYDNDEHYLSSILPVSIDINDQLKKIARNKNRSQGYYNNLIKKHQLKFNWVNDFKEFYPILLQNKAKHDAKPTHSMQELKKLKTLFPDQILQLMVSSQGEAIGGMTIFKTNARSAVIFYSMFNYNYSQIQPITLLMQHILPWAKKNKIELIDYGISHQPNAENPLDLNKSLVRFKEEFGCFASIRNTYKKKMNG